MSIDSQSEIAANLQIGPTSEGRVRIYVSGDGFDLPLDFDPEEADEIAAELLGAAERARAVGGDAGDRAATPEMKPNEGLSKRARRRRKKREAGAAEAPE